MSGIADPGTRRVLLYRLGSLGDMLIALPALRLVRRAFPKAEVRLLTNVPVHGKAAPAAAIFDGTGLVDGYLRYPAGVRDPRALLKLWWALWRWNPDVVVYLAAARGVGVAVRDRRFFRLCGARRFVGVPDSEAKQANTYGADAVRVENLRSPAYDLEPEAARLARNLSSLGHARLEDPASWDLALTAAEAEAARQAVGSTWSRQPWIAVSVGTKVQAKDWGQENWRQLLTAVAARFPGRGLMLVGAREEAAASEFAAGEWEVGGGGPVMNLCGLLQPRESAAALRQAELFVGHDSGPMHLAAAVSTPCVAVFAARNLPRQWFPFGEQHRILYHPVDCMGCGLETCIEQRKKCLLSITVAEVLREIEHALYGTSPTRKCASDAMMHFAPALPLPERAR